MIRTNPKFKMIRATRGQKWTAKSGTKVPTRRSFKTYDQISLPKGAKLTNKDVLYEAKTIMYGLESAVNWTPATRKRIMSEYKSRVLKKKIKALKKPPYKAVIGRGEIIRIPLGRKK